VTLSTRRPRADNVNLTKTKNTRDSSRDSRTVGRLSAALFYYLAANCLLVVPELQGEVDIEVRLLLSVTSRADVSNDHESVRFNLLSTSLSPHTALSNHVAAIAGAKIMACRKGCFRKRTSLPCQLSRGLSPRPLCNEQRVGRDHNAAQTIWEPVIRRQFSSFRPSKFCIGC
jgi:hypothetical protein